MPRAERGFPLLRGPQDEEKALYPAVDRHAGGGAVPSTACMRREHRIVERWIEQMDRIAYASMPDPAEFLRLGHELAALLRAHLEVEEEVLLPTLDRAMTPERFRREVGAKMGLK